MDDLERLYKEYYPIVYRFILKLCANPDQAEEIAQETMFRAIQQIHTFKGDSKLSTWLCTISKNLYFAEEKKRKKIVNDYPLETMPSSRDIEQGLANKEAAGQIHEVLHKLEEPYKEVFWMRTFADMSFKEIGSIFKKTESWARVTYYRAKIKVTEALK